MVTMDIKVFVGQTCAKFVQTDFIGKQIENKKRLKFNSYRAWRGENTEHQQKTLEVLLLLRFNMILQKALLSLAKFQMLIYQYLQRFWVHTWFLCREWYSTL